jgi:RNA polymerase sigma-70 factor (ECF subfamily)
MSVTDPAPDERILRDAVLRGDETGWRILWERYFDGIHAYVHWRLRRRAERADEIVQECWMIAVRSIRKFDPGLSTFGTWMRGIAANLLRNEERRLARDPVVARADDVREPAARPPADEPREAVAAVLDSLPADYRRVLVAKYCDGLAVSEIAAACGRTPKAVESLLTRAREAFREAWPSPGGAP